MANSTGSPDSDLVVINPAATLLGQKNAILTGTANRYYVPQFVGCLSIKTVVRGSALWEASGRQFVVNENTYLVLNDQEPYSMTIESARQVTTFCLFFKRGFVEDVFRGLTMPEARLLDSPQPPSPMELHFPGRLETHESRVLELTRALCRELTGEAVTQQSQEESLHTIAVALIADYHQIESAISRLPAVRLSTRREVYKRLLRGRDFILSSLDKPVRLAAVAREACLSPHHFHRAFVRAFGETPHAYLTRHRLQRACVLLESSNQSITEISLECGFESPGSFSSLFRRYYRTTPREFRYNRARE